MLGRDARLAAAVHGRADLLADRGDERFERLVVGGSLRDHAVSVGLRLGENGHAVGSLVHGEVFLLETEVGKDLLRGLVEFLSGFILRVDLVQAQDALALEDIILVLEHSGEPLSGGYDLRNADLAVSVRIDQLQSALVQGQVLGRTAEHRPEFLVEFSQMGDILARGDANPDHAPEGAVFPGIACSLFLCHIRVVVDDYFSKNCSCPNGSKVSSRVRPFTVTSAVRGSRYNAGSRSQLGFSPMHLWYLRTRIVQCSRSAR